MLVFAGVARGRWYGSIARGVGRRGGCLGTVRIKIGARL